MGTGSLGPSYSRKPAVAVGPIAVSGRSRGETSLGLLRQ